MGQITATTRLTQTHGGPPALSDWGILDPAAASVTLHFANSHLDAGTNGAMVARLYYNSVATFSGATEQGAQTTPFDCIGTTIDFVFSTSGIPPGSLVVGFMGSNTPGNTNSVDLTLFDDLAYCAYGTRVQSQYGNIVTLDPPLLLALLAFSVDGWAWPLLAFAAGRTFDIGTICAVAKPAPVYFTAAEIDRFVGANTQPPDQALLDKQNAWIRWALWSHFCECVPGSPTPYTPPVIVLPRPPGTSTGPLQPFVCDNTDLCTQFQSVLLALDAVLQRLDRIDGTVTLIQRQGVPFGYLAGTVHAGLFDQGEFTVADIIGLAIAYTSLPALYPPHPGDPPTYHQIGKVSVGTAEGWERSWMPTHDPYLILPVSGAVTRVGYFFPSGVIATITELVREP